MNSDPQMDALEAEQELREVYCTPMSMAEAIDPNAEDHANNRFDALIGQVRSGVQLEAITKETSDGRHTFAELYDYRMLYHAHAAHGWLADGIPVVKSWRHSDGERCFGGMFIVSAELPTGQVTNHYKPSNWNLFRIPEVEEAPEYDGHTPSEAAERLRAYLLMGG